MDVENTLVPGLLQLVSHAGYGAAKLTYPYLLPILDHAYVQVCVLVLTSPVYMYLLATSHSVFPLQLGEDAFAVDFLNKIVVG